MGRTLVAWIWLAGCGGGGGEPEDAAPPIGADAGPVTLLPIALEGSLQNPCWAPDASRLVLTRFRNGYNVGPADLVLVDLADHTTRVLDLGDADNVNLPGSCWRGDLVVYTSDIEERDEVFTVDVESGARTRITRRPDAVAFEPSFSPDGTRIVFESNPTGGRGNASIWQVAADGSGAVALTDGAGDDRQPNWAPRGDLIVFQSSRSGEVRLWLMASDGTSPRMLTDGDGTDASFAADGSRVVYSSDQDLPLADLFLVRVEGGPPVALTATSDYEGAPSLSPDGRRVAFETSPGNPERGAGTRIGLVALP